MYSKSVQILRYIRDNGPVEAGDIWQHFDMNNRSETELCLKDLYAKNLLRLRTRDLPNLDLYSITPDGLGSIEAFEKQSTLEEENKRLVSKIAEINKNLKELEKLKELEELRDITESIKTQTHIAIKKSEKADIKSWLSIFIAAATFALYIYEVLCKGSC